MRTRIQSTLLVGVALLAVGCGESPTSPSSPSTPPAATLTDLRLAGGGGLEVGGTAQMRADGLFSDGSTRTLTSQVTWTSMSIDLATIEPSGIATGVAFGTVTIQATYQGKTATRAIPVRGRRVNVTVTATTLTCGADCDGFTKGSGDFSFHAMARGTVGDAQSVTSDVLSQTAGYPDSDNVIKMANGQSRTLQNSATFQIREEAGAYVEVTFRATEWDEGVTRPVADGRMNNDSNTARFVWSTTSRTGWSGAAGDHSLSVGGSGCSLTLRYSIAIQPAN